MSELGHSRFARFTRIKHPVARNQDLLVEHLADETVVFDDRTKQAHCLSPLAAVVFAHCDGRTTVDQLAALATERLGEPVDEPRVIDALAQLQERDLLAVPPRDGLSRRQMIGKSAAAAAGVASVPLITSILAPASVHAASKTCGALLCCACCQNEDLNANDCCESPLVVTSQCECTGIRDNDTWIVNGQTQFIKNGKYCKPSGTAAPDDDFCDTLHTNAAGRQAFCDDFQGHITGGARRCCTCDQGPPPANTPVPPDTVCQPAP